MRVVVGKVRKDAIVSERRVVDHLLGDNFVRITVETETAYMAEFGTITYYTKNNRRRKQRREMK